MPNFPADFNDYMFYTDVDWRSFDGGEARLWGDWFLNGTRIATQGDYHAISVKDFGAIGDGVQDDTVAIQMALNIARQAGGGTVVIPHGTYKVTPQAHPQNNTYASCLIVGTKTRLLLDPGTVIKLADNTPALAPAVMHWLVLNYDIGGGSDKNISIEGGIFDGNAANQTVITQGVSLMRTVDCQCDNVTVMNCRGTAGSGPDESFHFEAQLGARTVFRNCKVIGNAGSTASGFSANGSTAIRYENCLASGMTVANGFTNNACSGILHLQCLSFDNTGHGFNSEDTDAVLYTGCVAGLEAAPNGISSTYGDKEKLGNSGAGFAAAYGSQVVVNGCIGKYNANGAGAYHLSYMQVIGGEFTHNLLGIAYEQGTTGSVIGHPKLDGNTQAAYSINNNWNGEWGLVIAPALPATGVPFTNPYPFEMQVEVTQQWAGSVYFIQISTANTGRTDGTFRLAPGAIMILNYSPDWPPSWQWSFGGWAAERNSASAAQAVAGTDHNTVMTPLRVKEAIDAAIAALP